MAESVSHRANLPPIGYLDMDKIKRESSLFTHNLPVTSALNMGAPPLASPSTMYSGPPPPYSYPSSAASSVVGGNGGFTSGQPHNGYMSPPDTARICHDEKDRLASGLSRQSLPSIQEALHLTPGEQQQNISISSLLSSTKAAPPKQSYRSTSPPREMPRSYVNVSPKGPPPLIPQHNMSNTRPYDLLERSNRSNFSPAAPNHHNINRSPVAPPLDTHHTIEPPRTAASPSGYTRPGLSTIQPTSPVYTQQPPATPSTSTAFGYQTYQPAYSYPPTTPTIPSYRPSLPPQSTWRTSNPDIERAEEVLKATAKASPPSIRPAYGESVKRCLDIFDLETSLNEIAEGSGRALDFSKHYSFKAHQTQRSGPTISSRPTVEECDEMIQHQTRVLDSMSRIRDVIIKQKQALAEQRKDDLRQSMKQKPPSEPDDDHASYMDKAEGGGGFAGADPKKRRGRAAPPGRCHSCNRAETPEWRRGPDGARTLCNACGLHYAKLTRKMGSKPSAGSTNLRPKEASPSSP